MARFFDDASNNACLVGNFHAVLVPITLSIWAWPDAVDNQVALSVADSGSSANWNIQFRSDNEIWAASSDTSGISAAQSSNCVRYRHVVPRCGHL